MTGRPLDDETEELMRDCEGRMLTLRSPEWNALRDHIRAATLQPPEIELLKCIFEEYKIAQQYPAFVERVANMRVLV